MSVAAVFPVAWSGLTGRSDSTEAARIGAAIMDFPDAAEAIVVDVLDRGTRVGSAVWVVRAALHAAVRRGVPVIVLDRPNPLTGEHAEGPVADSMAGSSDALYGLPSRHGMTIGEVARWLNGKGTVGAALTVVPVRGWRRSEWPAGRGAASLRMAGADVTAEALILAGAFAQFEASNMAIAPHGKSGMRIGASWLDAERVADALGDRLMPGVRYTASRDRFTAKSGGSTALPSLRVEITDRDRASGWRAVAAVFATIRAAHADSLAVDGGMFDRIVGEPGFRAALAAGEDPDTVVDRALERVVDFRRRAAAFLLYR